MRIDAGVLSETGKIGDLRGLFFDVADETLISGLRINGASVTGTKFAEDKVSDVGTGNNVNGSIINEYGKFDVGVAFGTAGIGKDDVREASFILSHRTVDLTYDFLATQDFAVRLTSVGAEGGSRDDSLKLGGTSPEASEPQLGAIGDTVFLDADGDGVRDAGEQGVANVRVDLRDAGGAVIATTVTDFERKYLFEGLAAGDYSLAVVAPAGFGFTGQNAGDDALDSDVNASTGMTAPVSLAEGEVNLTVDAGLVELRGALSGRYFCDLNENGVDDGEPGIEGKTVTLLAADGTTWSQRRRRVPAAATASRTSLRAPTSLSSSPALPRARPLMRPIRAGTTPPIRT